MTHWMRQLEDIARLWSRSRYAVAFTGAGISVPSGIPDFRSSKGLWNRYDPVEVASLQALRTNPRGVWEFLLDGFAMMDKAEPNPAHVALARLQAGGMLQEIITQNIDGLHQRAGLLALRDEHGSAPTEEKAAESDISQSSAQGIMAAQPGKTSGARRMPDVIEFHGGLQRFYCMSCGKDHNPEQARTMTRSAIPWLCDDCSGLVRPDVVFFGEGIPDMARREVDILVDAADLCLIVGTSGDVHPAAAIPVRIRNNGGTIIEINLGQTAFDGTSTVRIDHSCEIVLPELAKMLLQQ